MASKKVSFSLAGTGLAGSLPKEGRVFIGNEYIQSESDRFIDVVNPATEEVIYRSVASNEADIKKATLFARKALITWGHAAPRERAKYLLKIADLIIKYRDELARVETLNVGKPITMTMNREVPRAADLLHYYAGWCDKITGTTNQIDHQTTLFTVEEPVGVVGAIVPWNFPLILAFYKIAPALACGNTVVLKPSEYSPLSALFLGRIFQEAGLPEGVVNIVTGDGATGGLLVEGDVDKVAFTGSIATGKDILRRCSRTIKRVHLELGGKSPHVIFEDAPFDQSLDSVINGMYYNSGQVCIAGSRLFVHRKVHDKYVEKLTARLQSLVVGDPMNPGTMLGPLANKMQYEKVLGCIEEGKKERLSLISPCKEPKTGKGYYVAPVMFDHVEQDSRLASEEIFGPVLSCIEFDDMQSLMRMANSTIYGLAAGCWTRDINKALYFAKHVKAGIVWVNSFYCMDPVSPFGGYKQSGFGRDLGKESLNNYLETKSIIIQQA